jgi:mRNA interferase RelE/StbE
LNAVIAILHTQRFEPAAERFLKKLRDKTTYRRLREAIDRLCLDPYPPGCKKLVGRPGYRIRVGDYRIVYRVLDRELVVMVMDIGDRKDIYR